LLEDLDRDSGLLSVKVKGGDVHLVPFRHQGRPRHARTRHCLAGLTVERDRDQGGEVELVHALWLSPQGGLSHDGIYAIVNGAGRSGWA
jgi:hypothetical protein